MEDPRQNKEEKLQGGEIHLRPSMRAEREHGKVYKWFDNYWYHHKWKTIIGLFLTIVILVCSLQMCSKEKTGDISVLLGVPYAFEEEAVYNGFRSCISLYIPEEYDTDGDGGIRACVSIEGCDWWKTEFMVFNGELKYRATGGDQERVNGTKGQVLSINFTQGTGDIK